MLVAKVRPLPITIEAFYSSVLEVAARRIPKMMRRRGCKEASEEAHPRDATSWPLPRRKVALAD
jgi:hypothetical protein